MGSKSTTSTATQQLPDYINNAYQGLVGSAQQTGSQAYNPYTGGFTPDQQTAFQNIGSMWGKSDPAFGAASSAYGQSMVPTYANVSQYMSPYMDEVVSKAMANMQEQNAQGQQQVVGNAIAKGAMGGNRVGVAQSELARQQKLADGQTLSNLYNSGYGTALGAAQADKTAALQAAQGYTGLGQTQMQTGLAQAASQLGAGTQQQQFDYQQYLNQQAYPYQQQSWLASIIGGLGSTAGGTTTQTTPQGNLFSQLLGTGLQVAGMFRDGGRVRRADGGRVPLDIDMARNPARVMRDNPFGFWGQYDDAPQLNQRRQPEMLDFMAGGSERLQKPMDELWTSIDPIRFDVDGRGRMRQGMAVGGVPYANDNGQWPSYAAGFGASPYSNDNGDFGSYIPQAAVAGGGGRFPTIQEMSQPEDPFANPNDAMRKGAGNLKTMFSPSIAGGAAIPSGGFTPGLSGPRLFAQGGVVGRRGYAGGGVPGGMTPEEIAALYGDIIRPEGGLVGDREIPPPPPRPEPSTIDTVNPLNGDLLGLNVRTPDVPVPTRGEDPYIEYPADEPVQRAPISVPGGNAPGVVPYGAGEQFVTRPRDPTYSKNGWEAIQSLFGGKGLNLAPDANMGLMQAGAAMASSRSPFFLAGVGEGTTAGIQAWRDYQAMERENALARAGIGQKGEELAQKAIELGANVGLTNATTASIDTNTQMGQYDYRYTPFGVQVTDKTTGQPGMIYPYYSMMPDGQIATPQDGQDAPLFSTQAPTVNPDSRLMTEVGAGQAIGQATDAIKSAQLEASASQQTQQLLQEMRHNLAKLPENGIMTPGTAFPERANLAKGVNSYLQVFGLEPFFPEGEVAASEDLNKLTTRLGFDLSRMLGTGEAASVIMNSIAAVPGGANSPAGAQKIIAGLEAANRRRIDYYNAVQKWAAGNGGSVLGFDEWFNRQNPPELYALSSYVPTEAMEYLRANPQDAEAFNKKYGDGRDVARFVLGQ